MARRVFTNEYKRQILEQLLPPNNKTVPEIAASENIPKTTIYNWVAKARKDGQVIPNNSNPSNDGKWNELDKLRIVIETFSLNDEELGQYCRGLGLYTTDVVRWRKTMESALSSARPLKELEAELKSEREQNKKLLRELRYKEKALAETAALLVLRKKADAIWGDPEVD